MINDDTISLMRRIETLYPITIEMIQRSLYHLKASDCAWSDEEIIEALGLLAHYGCTGIDANVRVARIADVYDYSEVKNVLYKSLGTFGLDEQSAPSLAWSDLVK
ncbi:hypothetical protein [Bacillus altitudinis]|uniref:hypothetical protein n=1 Tax=Bacillus altitudinis TaxID=293387 RepID=UPI003982D088